MKGKKRNFKMIIEFLVIILIVGIFAGDIVEMTYATMNQGTPDVIVTINSNRISPSGNLLELKENPDYLWYPGREVEGVLRIVNESNRRTKIASLGLGVEITTVKDGYTIDQVKDSFLNHMHLSIIKGKLFSFDAQNIMSGRFSELVNKSFLLEDATQFTIGNNETIDLKYTVKMDEEAGNELQNLSAIVTFLINAAENPIIIDDDNDDDDNDDNDKDPTEIELIDIIPYGHWAHDCIIALLKHGVIIGYEDGTIRPENYVTRAETAALLGKALGLVPKKTLLPRYIDSIPEWAKGYVNVTSDEDIFKGYPFKLFKANKYITREEMITVLTRAFKVTLDDADLKLLFHDHHDISDWALENVKVGYEEEIIVGYPDNTYRPKNNITRAETFTIICKLMELHDKHTTESSAGLK